MIDVKKLITGFLILAAAAVCSVIILSLVSEATSSSVTAAQPSIDQNATTSLAGNAFLPDEPTQDIDDALASTTAIASSSDDPNNLTNILANSFLNETAVVNPDGAASDTSEGVSGLTPPDTNVVADDLIAATATQELQIPNWDVEAAGIPITILKASSSDQAFQYGTAIKNILDSHIAANTQIQNLLSNASDTPSPDDLTYLQSQIQNTLEDTAAVETPASLVGYQKSLIKVLVYEKNIVQLTNLAQTDPAKASLILQGESAKFSAAEQDLANQGAKIDQNVSLQQSVPAKNPGIILSFINNTFGIPTANAQFTVFDPSTWAQAFANEEQQISSQLLALTKNTLLQILKNTLIALIQKKVITWIQGSGAPRFITSWGTTLVNSYQQTALSAINTLYDKNYCGTYSGFLPQIRATLGAFYKSSNNVCANQFQAALGGSTLQQFYNHFSNGGFVAFGASTLPSGNPYGGLFFNAQVVDNTAQNARQAATAKAVAGNGFTGDQVCDDGSNPNGTSTICISSDGNDYAISGSEKCDPSDTPEVTQNGGFCADGTEPQQTSPAAATGIMLSAATNGTPQLVASANDVAGLLASVTNSLLNALASTAINAAGQFVNTSLTSVNPSNITGGGTAPAATPLTCTPVAQTIPVINATTNAPAIITASGGTTDSSGNAPTYYWVSSDGTTSTGSLFSEAFTTSGFYTVTLSDSSLVDATTTCDITVQ